MAKSSKTFNVEILLPEPLIQHIQSFLTRKEAARTSALSKSWFAAWSTRPTFDFDQHDFNDDEVRFSEVLTKNMQRYHDSNMKIDSFRLRLKSSCTKNIKIRLRLMSSFTKPSKRESENLADKLIASALQRGATALHLDFRSDVAYVLPREVLESEHLVRLSLVSMNIHENNNISIRCRRLKSLILHRVRLGSDDIIRDILSCCCLSIEELSLFSCTSFVIRKRRPKMIDLSGTNMFNFHKLRRLCLKKVRLDPLFFSDFGSRFPCLKDLSVSDFRYRLNEAIRIASTSLESMSFEEVKTLAAEFDVPNLVRVRYSGEGIPSLRIESSREWESFITITSQTHSNSWYLRLKKFLTQLRASKISLFMGTSLKEGREDIKVVSNNPLVVENLTIDQPRHLGYTFLSGLLSICRPKFLTINRSPYKPYPYGFTEKSNLWKRVMKEIITPNCEISDQNMFGQLGLKEASVEVLDMDLEDPWLLLFLNEPLHAQTTQKGKQMLRFRLRWR